MKLTIKERYFGKDYNFYTVGSAKYCENKPKRISKNISYVFKNKFKNKYGKTGVQLSKELNISYSTLKKWNEQNCDIFYKAKELNSMKGNRQLQRVWLNIHYRCENPNDKKYKYYGGKGIRVELTKYELNTLWNRDNANSLKQASIDRINSSKNYVYSNCRFIEMEDNRKNKS